LIPKFVFWYVLRNEYAERRSLE